MLKTVNCKLNFILIISFLQILNYLNVKLFLDYAGEKNLTNLANKLIFFPVKLIGF